MRGSSEGRVNSVHAMEMSVRQAKSDLELRDEEVGVEQLRLAYNAFT